MTTETTDNTATPEADVSPEADDAPALSAGQRIQWRIANHEAAHATVAAGLGFLPRSAAVITDGGWTSFCRSAYGFAPNTVQLATIAAAGPLGELLAIATDPPVRKIERIGIDALRARHTDTLDRIEADAGDVDAGPTDNDFIARHVTLVSDWRLWTERARYVHAMAQNLLEAHRPLHRAIAETLYHADFLGQDELENLVREHAPELMEAEI